MAYTGIKEVRKYNPDQFVQDFKKLYSFVVMTKYSYFFEVKKSDVWKIAKTREVIYEITRDLYVSRRDSMIIK